MKLIFLILDHAARNITAGDVVLKTPEFEGYSATQVRYHVGLCHEAGYIIADGAYGHYRGIIRVTWDGHEELDKLRIEYT